MRCEEIQERFIDLLYNEKGTPPASPELSAHVASCPDCQRELDELKATQMTLSAWQDEPPLRPVIVPVAPRRRTTWGPVMYFLRAGAIAALAVLALLAVADAELTWNKEGFSFRTHLFRSAAPATEYYTKAQSRELIKNVLDDTERRVMETNYLMLQRMMDTIEEDRLQDLRLVRGRTNRTTDKN